MKKSHFLATNSSPPSKLVVFCKDSCLPRICHCSQDRFTSARIRGALCNVHTRLKFDVFHFCFTITKLNFDELSLLFYRVKAHRVLGVKGTVVCSVGGTW